MDAEERALLAAIIAQPDDDTARLVYADWLQEHGNEDRAEFIRVEIELARTLTTTEDARRRKVLFGRRAQLLRKHKSAWLAPFKPYAKESSFVRGFVHSLGVPAKYFLQNAEKWFSLTPLTRIKITPSWLDSMTSSQPDWCYALFTSQFLAKLESLDLENLRLSPMDVGWLSRQADLPRLRELLLPWNALQGVGVAILAEMKQLRHLEILDLRGNNIDDAGARIIVGSMNFARLKELRMRGNSLHSRSWQMLEDRFGEARIA